MRRAAKAGIGLVALLAFWVFLAPTQIGGQDRYMITDGTSMLPTIRGGALVIVRPEPSYHVGEIVAYHNAQLKGAVVLHRIIAIKGGHYTFKGDHNSFADLGRPTKTAIVGAEWIYSPMAGQVWMNLRVPWVGALFLGVFGAWAFSDIGRRRAAGRHARHRHHRRALAQ